MYYAELNTLSSASPKTLLATCDDNYDRCQQSPTVREKIIIEETSALILPSRAQPDSVDVDEFLSGLSIESYGKRSELFR